MKPRRQYKFSAMMAVAGYAGIGLIGILLLLKLAISIMTT